MLTAQEEIFRFLDSNYTVDVWDVYKRITSNKKLSGIEKYNYNNLTVNDVWIDILRHIFDAGYEQESMDMVSGQRYGTFDVERISDLLNEWSNQKCSGLE